MLQTFALSAQTSRKPSLYEYQTREEYNGKTIDLGKPKTRLTSLAQINSKKDFNLMSRTFDEGTDYEIPHLIFAIDRENNKIYYINSLKYLYHEDFVRYLLNNRNLSREKINQNYKVPDRQFIFGTLSWLKHEKKFVYEFWEGDVLTDNILQYANKTIKNTFYTNVSFKVNSTLHEKVAHSINIPFITQEDVVKGQSYIALNRGKAKGKLRIVESVENAEDIQPTDILILKETPISIPPVAGIISEQPSTILSHVNILTRSWNVPNIYLRDASKVLKDYNNKYVELEAKQKDYSIKIINKAPKAKSIDTFREIEMPDITATYLFRLKDLKASDSRYCGAKAANLGAIKNRINKVIVPDGFAIPFGQYYKFVQKNKLYRRVKEMESLPDFKTNAQIRKQELEKLRAEIVSWEVDKKTAESWVEQWKKQLQGKGVFVRSSSNSEDLPQFSGAGLYTTIPNINNAKDLETAVKTVWASVFNYEAYEARRHAGIPQDGVMMSVFVQESIDSDYSGVMITKDPFDETRKYITYIAAKRGIGIKVVEGKKVAEQVMYSHLSESIQRISKSDEKTELRLNQDGGVSEVRIEENKPVLSDEIILKLVSVGNEIKYLFSSSTQDIEWAVKDGKIIILQARPYIN